MPKPAVWKVVKDLDGSWAVLNVPNDTIVISGLPEAKDGVLFITTMLNEYMKRTSKEKFNLAKLMDNIGGTKQ